MYEQNGIKYEGYTDNVYIGDNDLGRGFSIKRALNPVAAVKTVTAVVVKPLTKAPIALTKKVTASIVKPLVKNTLRVAMAPTKGISRALMRKSPMAAAILTPIESRMIIKEEQKKAANAGVDIPAEASYVDENGKTISKADYDTAVAKENSPLVNIYLSDGSSAQIPSGYVIGGKFVDDSGNVWTTTMPIAPSAPTLSALTIAASDPVSAPASSNSDYVPEASVDTNTTSPEPVHEEVVDTVEQEQEQDQDIQPAQQVQTSWKAKWLAWLAE